MMNKPDNIEKLKTTVEAIKAASEANLEKIKASTEAIEARTDAIKATIEKSREGFRFTDNAEEYKRADAAGESIVLAPALYLPHAVGNLCDDLRWLAEQANRVNELNSVAAYRELREVRRRLEPLTPKYQTQLAHCLRQLAEPVEGAPGYDAAWIQGLNASSGTSAVLELHIAYSDRAPPDRMALFKRVLRFLLERRTAAVAAVLLNSGSTRGCAPSDR